jgi:hypothetical protein
MKMKHGVLQGSDLGQLLFLLDTISQKLFKGRSPFSGMAFYVYDLLLLHLHAPLTPFRPILKVVISVHSGILLVITGLRNLELHECQHSIQHFKKKKNPSSCCKELRKVATTIHFKGLKNIGWL